MGRANEREARGTRALKTMAEAIGMAMIIADKRMETLEEEGLNVLSVRVRRNQDEDGGYLAVVTAEGETGRVVGFHGAATYAEASRGILEKLYNRSLKWREDKYGD